MTQDSQTLMAWDEDGTLLVNDRRVEFKYTRIGTMHYGEGTRKNLQMGAPYLSEAEAKGAIIQTARAWLSPLTNEPVGVTLPRDLAVLAQNVLFRNGFVSADDIEKAIKEYDARLSSAIGERG